MKPEDYEREPCPCPECKQAGVSDQKQIRDRHTGAWLHGYDLKRWYAAKERFWEQFHKAKNAIKDMA